MKKNCVTLFVLLSLLSLSNIYAQLNEKDFNSAVNFCIDKINNNIKYIPPDSYPIRTKGIGEWEFTNSSSWTSGFFPGCLWYSNLLRPDSNVFHIAEKFTAGLEKEQFNTSTHDIGFMMFCSYGNAYKQTMKENYKEILINSAKSLSKRFNPKIGCIQSWDGDFQVIIDNMMNLELLFWAAKNGGSKNLFDIAVTHANTTIKNHLRKDGSAYHVVVYDTANGQVFQKRTAQGLADTSAWARGQAWGIYGFTVCYRETHDIKYLNTAAKMAEYFIKNLPDDYIPYWDFKLPFNSDRKFKDASAAAIALSAFLELRNYIDDKSKYDLAINNIMSSLIKNYLSMNTGSAGLLLHCAYNANSTNPFDHDASAIWGDYYLLESFIRYKSMMK